MHIPDGFLDVKTAVATGAAAAAGVAWAAAVAQKRMPRRRVPLVGLAAGVIFAGQMLNFPVAAGTSGHLLGSVLAAVLLGPAGAVVAMTTVLIVQCLLFSDGGLTALGANILNMAIVGVLSGYAVYRLAWRFMPHRHGQVAAAAFGAWCATVLSALACALELAASGMVPARLAVPAMGMVHMVIGAGEAVITALVLAGIARSRPDLLEAAPATATAPDRRLVLGGLVLGVALALFAAPFASELPDGLEAVAEKFGFAERAATVVPAPMSDYRMPGVPWSIAATGIAGAAGTLLAFALAAGLARVLVPRQATPAPRPSAAP